MAVLACSMLLDIVFSKIFDKLMYQRLYKFLELFEILYPLQFGFRENHSITQALLSLTESIKSSTDNGKFGCGIFLDLQKAFDTVNHEILLQKLEHYGIRGNVLCSFQSYLIKSTIRGTFQVGEVLSSITLSLFEIFQPNFKSTCTI